MAGKESSGGARGPRLLLKAIRGLPEREQRLVLAYLLERALEPAEATPRQVLGPSFVTPEWVKELGGMAGQMLRSGRGIGGIAALYGVPDEVVRAALQQVASHPEGPQPLSAILALLADGRSRAEAAGELAIPKEELTRALEGLAGSPLEARLGKALFSYARMRAQASSAFAFSYPRLHPDLDPRRHGAPAGDPDGLAPRVARLLLADSDVGQVATIYGIPEDAVRAALREVAAHGDSPEPLASILRLVAEGRTRAELPEALGISEEAVTAALEELLPSSPAHRLSHALQASAAVRTAGGAPPAPTLPGVTVAGTMGAEQQMVPVRFPEPQYRRLKEWCGRHGFSMAVVVRGLVERFLDDQERRAA